MSTIFRPLATVAAVTALAACSDGTTISERNDNSTYSLTEGRGVVADVRETGETRDVSVEVRDVRQEGGRVYVAVQTEEQFAELAGTATTTAAPEARTIEVSLADTPDGRIAVAAFQDTDGDGTLTFEDGIPTEPYGFSGPLQARQPEFDGAAFDLAQAERETVVVNLKLLGKDGQPAAR